MEMSKKIQQVSSDVDDNYDNTVLDCDLHFLTAFEGSEWKSIRELDHDLRYDDDINYDSEEDIEEPSIIDRKSLIKAMEFDGCQPQFDDESNNDMIDIDESGFVKKSILIEGSGDEEIPKDSNVIVEYLAYAQGSNGSDPFDSTFDRKRPSGISLNDDRLLKGFSLALKSMKIGEVSKFLVHPDYAFREQGHEPRIPKNAHILYVIELVRLVPKNGLTNVLFTSGENRKSLPFEDMVGAAEFCKKDGKLKYDNEEYVTAVKLLSIGISILEEYSTSDPNDTRKRDDLVTTLCLNKAQCYIKMKQPARACNALKLAIRTENDGLKAKACLRFVEAKLMLDAFGHAEKYYNMATQLFKKLGIKKPSKCDDLKKLILKGKAEEVRKEKELYGKMFQINKTTQ